MPVVIDRNKNVLILTLQKKWFDMILSGEKKEEYRELKPYWHSRIRNKCYCIKDIKLIMFRNGYSKTAREMVVQCKGIQIRTGKKEWGAEPGEHYYCLILGKILITNNLKQKEETK